MPCDGKDGLLNLLRNLNAKERFYLVGHFLGNRSFSPALDVIEALEKKLGVPGGIFSKAEKFCAMDYHLDWINAALEKSFEDECKGDKVKGRTSGYQDDIDLLLAFDTKHSPRYHIILVDAKGIGYFSNRDLETKTDRLDAIFYDANKKDIERFKQVKVYLVLASPCEPKKLKFSDEEKEKRWNWKHIELDIRFKGHGNG